MIKLRKYRSEDAAAVDEIYERCHGHFNLPRIDKCVGLAVVEKDGKVVALGAIQVIPELILVLDTDIPKRDQVTALKELLNTGEIIAHINGFTEIYAFPDSSGYADVLKKHFSFQDGNPILIKRIDDGEQTGKANQQND